MQLYVSPTSPFSRKVRIAVRELGLGKEITEIMIDPWTDAGLREFNPLAKVPTLVLPDGLSIFESAVICDYLDQKAKSEGLSDGIIPDETEARLLALRWQGLADGMMAAAGRLYADCQRDENDRSQHVMDRQVAAIEQSIAAILEGLASLRTEKPHLGSFSVLCGLYYLDFRFPDRRFEIPIRIRDWMAIMAETPSIAQTPYRLLQTA